MRAQSFPGRAPPVSLAVHNTERQEQGILERGGLSSPPNKRIACVRHRVESKGRKIVWDPTMAFEYLLLVRVVCSFSSYSQMSEKSNNIKTVLYYAFFSQQCVRATFVWKVRHVNLS